MSVLRKFFGFCLCFVLLLTLAPAVHADSPPPPEGKSMDNAYISVLQPEHRMARQRIQNTGGPDGFGYTFIDSHETDGPAFRWIEIERTGIWEDYLSQGDDRGAIVDIGFDMQFYGETFDEIGISTNGYLSFDKHLYRNADMFNLESGGTIANLGRWTNDPIPFPFTPDALIAPFWDDLHPGLNGNMYYQTLGEAPNRFFIVEWLDVARYQWSGVSTRNTLQVIIFEGSSDIQFQYLTQSGEGDVGEIVAQGGSATIGLEDFGPYPDVADGGLQYSYNTSVISEGLAILFEYPNATASGDPQLDDWFEATYGVSTANADDDGDGLSNLEEQNARTDPTKVDTDNDGADDSAEVTAGTLGYFPDSDNDQLPDGYELDNAGFDPLDPDVDEDGLVDGLEGLYNCDPMNDDTDGDDLLDGWEAQYIVDFTLTGTPLMFPDNADGDRNGTNDWAEDPDGDTLKNNLEQMTGADPTETDTDGDGLDDYAEYTGADGFLPTHGSDTDDQTDPASVDSDGDGIEDDEEIVAGADGFVTNPTFLDVLNNTTCNPGSDGIPDGWDTDCDGMPDGWETRFGLDPTVKDGTGNLDGDGLTNVQEYENHTFPNNTDSDGDGLSDSEEVDEGDDLYITDPTGEDFNNDGTPDGRDTDKDGASDGEEYLGLDGLDPTNPGDADDQTDPTDPDTDDDGMPDGFEYDYSAAAGLDPNSHLPGKVSDWDKDPDADQLNNLGEYRAQTNPDDNDTDGDTLQDGVEFNGTGAEVTFANQYDSDFDGLDDEEETSTGDDGYVTEAINPDSDGDFLMDGEEYEGADGNPGTTTDRTMPLDTDTDDGGALDGWEVYWGYNARDDTDDDDDGDADGLTNAEESQYPRDLQRYGGINGFVSDPTDADTDDDGILDGDEADDAPPSNPTLPDSDGGGAWDIDESLIIPPDTTSSSLDATDPTDDYLRRIRDTMRHYIPDVAVDSQNYAHLVWREVTMMPDGYSGYDLYYAMTNPDGTYRIAPTRLTGYYAPEVPKVVVDDSDVIHVVWEDERWDRVHDELLYMHIDPAQDDQNGDVASPTAVKILYDTNLTHYNEPVQGITQDLRHYIAMDNAGDIHVAWWQSRTGNTNRVMYMRFTPSTPGNPDVDPIEVALADSVFWTRSVKLDTDSNNYPHLVWYNLDLLDPAYDNTNTHELYYAMLDTDGTPLIDKTLITADDNNQSYMPDVVVDGNDEVNVVWTDAAGLAEEIYYMRLDPSLDDQDGSAADLPTIQIVAPYGLTNNDGEHSRYAACELYESELHVLWADYRNAGNTEVYYGSYDIAASGNPDIIHDEIRLEDGTTYPTGDTPGLAADSTNLLHGVWTAWRPDPEPGYATYNVQHLAHRFFDVPVDHFTFETIASPQLAGVNFTIVITAENTSNELVSAYGGQADLTINAGGSIAPDTANFINGVASLNVKIANNAEDVQITATDGATTGQSNTFDVRTLERFTFETIKNQIVNEPFTITLTAVDNMDEKLGVDYTVALTDSTKTLSPDSVVLVDGGAALSVTISVTQTDVVITATYNTISGTSNLFDVTEMPDVDHFSFDTITSPQYAGDPFTITITAEDALSQTVTTYNGVADLSINVGSTINPTSAAFTDGIAEIAVTMSEAAEDVQITATDNLITGQSNPFEVRALDRFEFETISTQVINQAFEITLNAIDTISESISISCTVTLTDATGTISPTMVVFDHQASQTINVTISVTQTDVVITATCGTVTGVSNRFDIVETAATPDHFEFDTIADQTEAPFPITIRVLDILGDPIALTGTVSLQDSTGSIAPTTTSFTNQISKTLDVTIGISATHVVITATHQPTVGDLVTGYSNPFAVTLPAELYVYLPLVLRGP